MLSRRTLHAVDDVSFAIGEREIVALAGESGSGKSTIARLLARIYPPTSGEVYFFGRVGEGAEPHAAVRDALTARRGCATAARCRWSSRTRSASINPVFRVSHGVLRSLKLHRPELSAQAAPGGGRPAVRGGGAGSPSMLAGTRTSSAAASGSGSASPRRWRAGRLILADEPVSMLDVSIRIGLLNLMATLRDTTGVSILYITHDIASARYVADRLIVMYAGQIAESGPIEEVLADPRHPYTQLLVSGGTRPARAALGRGAERARRAAEGG